ncbi:hypothetical protein AVEN_66943-1 [Araneus ventricosus]|uniref:Mos1 transposase HTH domain-containing protein n=1 Tax=Araneus ventricosus TaxID=182803 RepID=A0A4Y2V675_ARAVE|nr:hypothetical protein AVEN_66943-1 [Araneus ventricosus]
MHTVIRFLTVTSVSAVEIHRQLTKFHRKSMISREKMAKWYTVYQAKCNCARNGRFRMSNNHALSPSFYCFFPALKEYLGVHMLLSDTTTGSKQWCNMGSTVMSPHFTKASWTGSSHD